MSLNRSTLKIRSYSAAVFVVIVLACVLLSHWTFFLLFTLIHFGCWREYQRLVSQVNEEYSNITAFHRYGIMLAGFCFLLYFTNDDFRIGDFLFHPIGWWLGLLFAFVLPISELLFTTNISLKNIGYSAFGLLYISMSCGLMIDLLVFPAVPFRSTPIMPMVIILCMWVNDTMAYLVGSLIGKTPFSSISPKKTWEGTIGGIVLCVTVIALLSRAVPVIREMHIVHWIMIPLLAAVAGTVGDLFESKLKRMAGVKDSGRIMPGHGGFLDRFDSLLFATPFVWMYVEIILRR